MTSSNLLERENVNLFLRNDDVRGCLDAALLYLTERVVEHDLVVSHAVEPRNVSGEVVDWLLRMQEEHPAQVEIIQHGFDHQLKTAPPVRGEFGGGRPYAEQLDEIRRGAERMNQFFGDQWSRIFSFPFGLYDLNTLKALEQCGFKVISTGIRLTRKRKAFNAAGRFLRQKTLLGRNVAYFNETIPGFKLREIPVVLNNTKKQTGPDIAVQYTTDELKAEWDALPNWLKVRGVLCHHRFNSKADIDELIIFLSRLKDSGVKLSRIGDIHE